MVILAVMSLVILSVILLTPGKRELSEKWKKQSHRGEELQCGELKERCEFFGEGNVRSGGEFAEKINIFNLICLFVGCM